MGGVSRFLLKREAAKLFDDKHFRLAHVLETEQGLHDPRQAHRTPDTFWPALDLK